MIARRSPHQVGKAIAKGINSGEIDFADKHLSMFPQDLTYGYYSLKRQGGEDGKMLDWAIVEATEILPDGSIVPGASVGATPEILQTAEKIIIEVNTSLPSFKGLHDISPSHLPPHRQPYLVQNPSDRIGQVSVPVDPERVVAIIETDKPDNTGQNAPETEDSKLIAQHLIQFFEDEVAVGRMPKNLHPLQSGIGNVANSIIAGLRDSKFERLQVWTEVLQDSFLPLLNSGKLDFATATSIRFSPEMFKEFYRDWDQYQDKLLLRPQQTANSPEIIRRLGVIGMSKLATTLLVACSELDVLTPPVLHHRRHSSRGRHLRPRQLDQRARLAHAERHRRQRRLPAQRQTQCHAHAVFVRFARPETLHLESARLTPFLSCSRPSKTDPTGISCIVPFATHVDQSKPVCALLVLRQDADFASVICPFQPSTTST